MQHLEDYGFDYLEWLEGYADILAQAEQLQKHNEHAEQE